MILIGLTGRAQSGKDSVADYLEVQHGFIGMAFADPIKNALLAMFDEDIDDGRDKEAVIDWIGKSSRELMQTLGTEWGRQMIHEDVWVRCLERALDENLDTNDPHPIVLTDVRFENEARWVRQRGGTIWRIERPDARAARAHSSEAGIPDDLVGLVIVNDGTLDRLHAKVNTALLVSCGLIPQPDQETAL